MEKNYFFILILGILVSVFSCSDKMDEGIDSVSKSELPLAKKARALECVKKGNFVLPNIMFANLKDRDLITDLVRDNKLSLAWENVKYEERGLYHCMWIPIVQTHPFSVYRYFKEQGKNSKIILTSLYSYLFVREYEETGTIFARIVSYAPDKRYLRNRNLSFENFLEKNPLENGFSGLYIASDLDGHVRGGELYYNGKLKYKFSHRRESSKTVQNSFQSVRDSLNILGVYYLSEFLVTKGFNYLSGDNEFWGPSGFCIDCGRLVEYCICSQKTEDEDIVCAYCHEWPCECTLCVCRNYPYECICPCKGCGKELNFCTCKRCNVCGLTIRDCPCFKCEEVCGTNKCKCESMAL